MAFTCRCVSRLHRMCPASAAVLNPGRAAHSASTQRTPDMSTARKARVVQARVQCLVTARELPAMRRKAATTLHHKVAAAVVPHIVARARVTMRTEPRSARSLTSAQGPARRGHGAHVLKRQPAAWLSAFHDVHILRVELADGGLAPHELELPLRLVHETGLRGAVLHGAVLAEARAHAAEGVLAEVVVAEARARAQELAVEAEGPVRCDMAAAGVVEAQAALRAQKEKAVT
eukprot:CAMPEP_0206042188 /NCGR_PEP_ID=MMETSP1466-20131121/6405_1 /ASSEMBLY_ACC=CAM_ASM_001126 /TAXON_ID=44452 /ORGANISM="Pavlova gyrans, Strain CCMP608" /LENGTH=231 /DNA_ID=CAMNT_0053416897 /DNA_START=45 /DNA_END=737 /DNA_ORIENTATION=+